MQCEFHFVNIDATAVGDNHLDGQFFTGYVEFFRYEHLQLNRTATKIAENPTGLLLNWHECAWKTVVDQLNYR